MCTSRLSLRGRLEFSLSPKGHESRSHAHHVWPGLVGLQVMKRFTSLKSFPCLFAVWSVLISLMQPSYTTKGKEYPDVTSKCLENHAFMSHGCIIVWIESLLIFFEGETPTDKASAHDNMASRKSPDLNLFRPVGVLRCLRVYLCDVRM